jgi:hypothetical protein
MKYKQLFFGLFFGLFITGIVNAQPISVTITSSAVGNNICSGGSVTFTATQSGASSPLYQWKKNGTAIPGATSSTYTTSGLVNNDVISVDVSENVASVLATNLVLNLDASNAASYPGTGTTWTDLSGAGHDGTLNGTPLPTYVSSPVAAFQFTSSSSTLSANRVNTSTNFLGDDMTLSAWIKTSNVGSGSAHYRTMYILAAEQGGGANDWGFGVNSGGKLAFGAGPSDATIATTASVNTDNWVHVAVTRTKSTGQIKLYINGILDKTGTGNSGNSLTVASQIWIGSGQDGPAFSMGGLINDVLAYSSVLSAEDIFKNACAQGAKYDALPSVGSNTITTTVSAYIGGTLSSSASVCNAVTSTSLSLSGYTGSIVKWQSSTDNWATSSDINLTTTSLLATGLPATTKFRVVVESAGCQNYSNEITVTP